MNYKISSYIYFCLVVRNLYELFICFEEHKKETKTYKSCTYKDMCYSSNPTKTS